MGIENYMSKFPYRLANEIVRFEFNTFDSVLGISNGHFLRVCFTTI